MEYKRITFEERAVFCCYRNENCLDVTFLWLSKYKDKGAAILSQIGRVYCAVRYGYFTDQSK